MGLYSLYAKAELETMLVNTKVQHEKDKTGLPKWAVNEPGVNGQKVVDMLAEQRKKIRLMENELHKR